MKLRTAIKILRSNNNYWCRQVDDYDVRGIKNKAYIASRRIIRNLNKYIKTECYEALIINMKKS